MTFLQNLKQAAKSPTAIFTAFLQEYLFAGGSVHIFLEGQQDSSFYTNFINQFNQKSYKLFFYICGNKDNVYASYLRIDWTKYNKNRLLFFVDKDLSDIIPLQYVSDTNIFVTRFYSIENYCVNIDILERLNREIIHIQNSTIISELNTNFDNEYKKFQQSVTIIMAWIIHHKRIGTRPNIDNIQMQNLFYISEDLTFEKRKTKLLGYLDKVTGVLTPHKSSYAIKNIVKALGNCSDKKIYLRGKFETWFFVTMFTKTLPLINRVIKKGETKYRIYAPLNQSNFLEIAGSRLKIPHDLFKFLDINFSKI